MTEAEQPVSCQRSRNGKSAKQDNSEHRDVGIYALGCLTAGCGGILVIWATICALARLARWGLGW